MIQHMIPTSDLSSSEAVYTVSRLNSEAKQLLEEAFPAIWVEGEISNFAAPHSGHWYFCLKDATAQVRCAMFRSQQRNLGFIPKDGQHVLVRARISLYEGRGEFQLIAEFMEERGEGKLRKAFELLKKKLESAGLFNPDVKKSFPAFPKQIGIITSSTGAAIRDVLTALKRRFHCVPIIIYPTLVQGNTAASTIVQAIETANRRRECDVLILTRGGGSLEDLWPFNEEIVAHAIFKSDIPIISGIGHEVDFTIADFVADKRAATPTAAAELITPDKTQLHTLLMRQQQMILRLMQQKLLGMQKQVEWTQKHLSQLHPKRRLTERMQQLDLMEVRLMQLQYTIFNQLNIRLKEADARLHRLTPIYRIKQLQQKLKTDAQQLEYTMQVILTKYQTKLANAAATLDAMSPLAVLKRGFAITLDKDHHLVHSVKQLTKGEHIDIQLSDGRISCEVLATESFY